MLLHDHIAWWTVDNRTRLKVEDRVHIVISKENVAREHTIVPDRYGSLLPFNLDSDADSRGIAAPKEPLIRRSHVQIVEINSSCSISSEYGYAVWSMHSYISVEHWHGRIGIVEYECAPRLSAFDRDGADRRIGLRDENARHFIACHLDPQGSSAVCISLGQIANNVFGDKSAKSESISLAKVYVWHVEHPLAAEPQNVSPICIREVKSGPLACSTLRQLGNIGRNPPRLVFGQQLCSARRPGSSS
jgi:hypothetical protein